MRARHATTPDGVPLASWRQRVGASVVDGVISAPIVLVLGFPFYRRLLDVFERYLDDVSRAIRAGNPAPSDFALEAAMWPAIVRLSLLGIAFSLVWTFAWLRWKQATPGKLLLGLRVRRRAAPGPLSWGAIAMRWLGEYGFNAMSLFPVVGTLVSIYITLDSLWPLWDQKRQALHDKLAGTNVVRVR